MTLLLPQHIWTKLSCQVYRRENYGFIDVVIHGYDE